MMRVFALTLILFCSACRSSGQEWPAWPDKGPLVVSRPPAGVDEYFVEMRPGFDQETYAKIISSRVKGKIGYVYKHSEGFTIYDISEADIGKIRQMPEVKSVTKLGYGKLAAEKRREPARAVAGLR
jgi:hypothetical protein